MGKAPREPNKETQPEKYIIRLRQTFKVTYGLKDYIGTSEVTVVAEDAVQAIDRCVEHSMLQNRLDVLAVAKGPKVLC